MSAIKLHALTPNVIVDDVTQTVKYYTEMLGFTFITAVPETGAYQWAMVKRDDVTLMFQSLHSLQEDLPELNILQKGSIGTFFIEMDDIHSLYENLKEKVEILGDLRTTFYGKVEFTIKDLNGYFLTFAEDVQ